MNRILLVLLCLFALSARADDPQSVLYNTNSGMLQVNTRASGTQFVQVQGGNAPMAVCARSSNYTISATDGCSIVEVTTGSSTISITLPFVQLSTGRVLTIKKMDSGTGTVQILLPNGQIDGAIGNLLTAQYAYVRVQSDGNNWPSLGAWDSLYYAGTSDFTSNTVLSSFSGTIYPGTWNVYQNLQYIDDSGPTFGTADPYMIAEMDTSSSGTPSRTSIFGNTQFGIMIQVLNSTSGYAGSNSNQESLVLTSQQAYTGRVAVNDLTGGSIGYFHYITAVRQK